MKKIYPKIIFRYSWIYDQIWKEGYLKSDYPEMKETLKFMYRLEKIWQKYEKKILAELSKITKLSWTEKEILIYVVGRKSAFSDPLTICVKPSIDYCIDILTHELIHRITWTNNISRTKKAWDYFYKRYKNESIEIQHHIPTLAIHWKIYLNLFNQKRLDRDRKFQSKFKEYKKAWDIVEKERHQKIIKEFTSRISKS